MKNVDQKKLSFLLNNFIKLKGECHFKTMSDLDLSQLTVKQLEYLAVIDEIGATTISRLADRLVLKKPTVTETVHKLEKYNCIEKHQCEEDGRIYYITLTDKGEKIARLEDLSEQKLSIKILSQLTVDELNLFMELLEKITAV